MEMEKEINLNSVTPGNSLVVQLLGLCPFTAEDAGSIPGQGIKISKLHGSAKKKKKQTGDIYISPKVAGDGSQCWPFQMKVGLCLTFISFLHNLVSFPVIVFSALDSCCFMVDFEKDLSWPHLSYEEMKHKEAYNDTSQIPSVKRQGWKHNPCPGYSPLTDTQQSFICLITLPQPLREPREKKGVITFVKSPKPSAFMQCVCFQSTFISAVLGAVTKRLPCHTSHQKEGTAALVLAVSLVLFTNKRVCDV